MAVSINRFGFAAATMEPGRCW